MRRWRLLFIALVVIGCLTLMEISEYSTKTTTISLRIGQPFDEVVRASTYPVRGGIKAGLDNTGFGWTYVTEPATIIEFNDPQYRFVLPPTTFAAVTYLDGKVKSVSTSPMLHRESFDAATQVLDKVQKQLKVTGWSPESATGRRWFDLTPAGKQRLHARLTAPGWSDECRFSVPEKYHILLRITCSSGCSDRTQPELYLVDVGMW